MKSKARIEGDIENICCFATYENIFSAITLILWKPNFFLYSTLTYLNPNSTQPKLNFSNFDSTSLQPQPQYQPQLNLNFNLNSIGLWHKSNPILFSLETGPDFLRWGSRHSEMLGPNLQWKRGRIQRVLYNNLWKSKYSIFCDTDQMGEGKFQTLVSPFFG